MSTLLTIRTLLEDQLNVGTTSTSTDPSSTLLNTYINTSQRLIARRDRPRELMAATVTEVNITANTNTVAIPATIFMPDIVYYTYSGGSIQRCRQKTLERMINLETASNFFDTTNTGDPIYYDVRGTSILFNKYFNRTASNVIKIYGLGYPTTLSSDVDSSSYPSDYDLLTVYEAAILFYQRDDDTANQIKYQQLAERERQQLTLLLDTNDESEIYLDPNVFTSRGTNFGNPSVLFSS